MTTNEAGNACPETAWVIEDGTSPAYAPLYLSGITFMPPGRLWSRGHLLAIRFARRVDAEKIAVSIPHTEVRIAEHAWG